jgi:hypothetical protein
MLQGHFVVLWLDDRINKNTNSGLHIYESIRGVTAPLFLTITGIVFTFLLFRGSLESFNQERFKKGKKRIVILLVWAYVLQINFHSIYSGIKYWKADKPIFDQLQKMIGERFFTFHILHSISFGILFILLIYYLFAKFKAFNKIGIGFLIGAFVFFAGQPFFNAYFNTHDQISFLPKGLSTIFGGENSVFPIFPSGAYVLSGAFIGYKLAHNEALFHTKTNALKIFLTAITLLLLGLIIPKYLNVFLGPLFGSEKFFTCTVTFFLRFSEALLVILLIAWIATKIKNIHPFALKIGQNTLSIYIIHSIILYGCMSGFGLDSLSTYINKNPELLYLKAPIYTISFAVLFLSLFVLQIAFFEKLNNLFFRTANLLTRFKNSTEKPNLLQQVFTAIVLEVIVFICFKSIL